MLTCPLLLLLPSPEHSTVAIQKQTKDIHFYEKGKEKRCYYVSSYTNYFWGKLTRWDRPGGDLPHPPQKGKQTVAGDSDQHIAQSPGDLCH